MITVKGVVSEIQVGNSSGGYSSFGVKGTFTSDTRIEGQWMWEEITAWSAVPTECTSEAEGFGHWVAVKK